MKSLVQAFPGQTQKALQDFILVSVIKKLVPTATSPTLKSNTSLCEQYLSTLNNFCSSWPFTITPFPLRCMQNTLSIIIPSVDVVPSDSTLAKRRVREEQYGDRGHKNRL